MNWKLFFFISFLCISFGMAETVLTGYVRDSDNTPIENARVHLSSTDTTLSTCEEGSFAFNDLVSIIENDLPETGQSLNLTIESDDMLISSPISIKRVVAYTIQGRIIQDIFSGTLDPGSHRLSWNPGGSVHFIQVVTADGSYVFRHFPQNRGRSLRRKLSPAVTVSSRGTITAAETAVIDTLSISHPDYTEKEVSIETYDEVVHINLERKTKTLTGYILMEDETPIENAQVVLESTGNAQNTDREGRFSFSDLTEPENGEDILNVSHADFADTAVTIDSYDETVYIFPERKTKTLTGYILLDNETPIQYAQVVLESTGDSQNTDREGRFSFSDLTEPENGEDILNISHADYIDTAVTIDSYDETVYIYLEENTRLVAQIDRNRCSNCRHCIRYCPNGAIVMDGWDVVIDPDLCEGESCGDCMNACSKGAISFVEVFFEKMSALFSYITLSLSSFFSPTA
ncbi:MAG: 4Fe-4S dicluster domain-containing protein [Fibrobacterota bacterium]